MPKWDVSQDASLLPATKLAGAQLEMPAASAAGERIFVQ